MQTFIKIVAFIFVAGTLMMLPSCDPENVLGPGTARMQTTLGKRRM